jgi:hypothetical protein
MAGAGAPVAGGAGGETPAVTRSASAGPPAFLTRSIFTFHFSDLVDFHLSLFLTWPIFTLWPKANEIEGKSMKKVGSLCEMLKISKSRDVLRSLQKVKGPGLQNRGGEKSVEGEGRGGARLCSSAEQCLCTALGRNHPAHTCLDPMSGLVLCWWIRHCSSGPSDAQRSKSPSNTKPLWRVRLLPRGFRLRRMRYNLG